MGVQASRGYKVGVCDQGPETMGFSYPLKKIKTKQQKQNPFEVAMSAAL